ncbi:MAG: hypothetical protein ACLRVU_09805 [Beduini sp.]|uniref:hypothetical protein n=1 Tax=Beduini sp. TaxID=1922300 RepID=UPI0039A0563F
MRKIILVPNAKDMNGKSLNLNFFNKDICIAEKKHRTYIIRCGDRDIEVYHDQVKIIEQNKTLIP